MSNRAVLSWSARLTTGRATRSPVRARWLGALLLLCAGCRKPTPAPAPGTPEDPLLSVDGSVVSYNGQVLPWDDTDGWRRVFGPPSRETDGILTWDDLGVVLFDRDPKVLGPETVEVLLGRAMHSSLTQGEPARWPRKTFTARLTVDRALLTRRSTIMQINLDKQGPSFQTAYTAGVYNYSTGPITVWLEFGHDNSLTTFSMEK